jgi:hypothetical protein
MHIEIGHAYKAYPVSCVTVVPCLKGGGRDYFPLNLSSRVEKLQKTQILMQVKTARSISQAV